MTENQRQKSTGVKPGDITYLLTPCSRVLLEKLTGFVANQEIPRIFWNPKVHYRTHKCPDGETASDMKGSCE